MRLAVLMIIFLASPALAVDEFEGKGVEWLSQATEECSVTEAEIVVLTQQAKKKAIAHGTGLCKGIADRVSEWVLLNRCHVGSPYGGLAAYKVHAKATFNCLGTDQGHDL